MFSQRQIFFHRKQKTDLFGSEKSVFFFLNVIKIFLCIFQGIYFLWNIANYFYLKYPHPRQLKAMVMFMVFNATFNNILSYSVGLNVMWLFPNQPIDTRTLYIQLYNLHDKHIHTLFPMKWLQTFILCTVVSFNIAGVNFRW